MVVPGLGLAEGSLVTVGRWMSAEEFGLMVNSGRVVESTLGGVTNVAFPASSTAYTAATEGSLYVEFKVAPDALRAADGTWAKIWGPTSIFGRKFGTTEMPKAVEPIVKAVKGGGG